MKPLGSEFNTDSISNRKGWLMLLCILLYIPACYPVWYALFHFFLCLGASENLAAFPAGMICFIGALCIPFLFFGHEQKKVLQQRRLRLYQQEAVKRIGYKLNAMSPEELQKLWTFLYPNSKITFMKKDKYGRIYEITPIEESPSGEMEITTLS